MRCVNENIVNSILGSRKSKDCNYMLDLSIREDWIDHYCSKIYHQSMAFIAFQ